MSILLKAKSIKVNDLFKDPKSSEVLVMRAHDKVEGTCLAERPDGTFWDCDGEYMVITEAKSFPLCPECESNRNVKPQTAIDSWVCYAPVHRYNRAHAWVWNEGDIDRDNYVKTPDDSMPPRPPDCPNCGKLPNIEGKTFWKNHGKYFCPNCSEVQIMDGCSPGYFNGADEYEGEPTVVGGCGLPDNLRIEPMPKPVDDDAIAIECAEECEGAHYSDILGSVANAIARAGTEKDVEIKRLEDAIAERDISIMKIEEFQQVCEFMDAIEVTEITTAEGDHRDIDGEHGIGFTCAMQGFMESVAGDESDPWCKIARQALKDANEEEQSS